MATEISLGVLIQALLPTMANVNATHAHTHTHTHPYTISVSYCILFLKVGSSMYVFDSVCI